MPARAPASVPVKGEDVAQLRARLSLIFRRARDDWLREFRDGIPQGDALWHIDDHEALAWERVSKAPASDAADAVRRSSPRWSSEVAHTLTTANVAYAVKGVRLQARSVGAEVETLNSGEAMVASMKGRRTRIRVLDEMRARGTRDARRLADRMERDVRESFARVLQRNGNVDDAEREALRIFDGLSDWGAERIARDQLGKAAKEGRQAFARGFSDLFLREWMASPDGPVSMGGRVRESHWAMHGRRVGVNEPWVVDYSLDRPALPAAVPEMVPGASVYGILCRCDFVLVERDEEEDVPAAKG